MRVSQNGPPLEDTFLDRRAATEEGERRAIILIRLGNPSAEKLVQPRYENLQKEDGKENLDPHHLRHCFE